MAALWTVQEYLQAFSLAEIRKGKDMRLRMVGSKHTEGMQTLQSAMFGTDEIPRACVETDTLIEVMKTFDEKDWLCFYEAMQFIFFAFDHSGDKEREIP